MKSISNVVHAVPIQPEASHAVEEKPFRIQFSTMVIAPAGLPDFPYTSTALLFNAVVYTAIVWAPDHQQAMTRVRKFWPECTLRFLEQGQKAFKADDYLSQVNEFGTYKAKPDIPWMRRVLTWKWD